MLVLGTGMTDRRMRTPAKPSTKLSRMSGSPNRSSEGLQIRQPAAELGFPDQQTFYGVERAVPSLRWIKFPTAVLPTTSRRVRKAGSAGSKDLSNASSFPVAFSRILRTSSRSSMAK